MVKQVIKNPSNHRFEESLEPVRIGGNCFVLQERSQHAHLQFSQFPISAPGHCFIEAKLITKVLEEQAFVVTRRFGNSIHSCPIETMLCKDSFCRVKDRLTCALSIMHPSSSTFRIIHIFVLLLFFSNQLLK